MNGNCDIKNPLIRDGVSRKQRSLKALQPDYVKVDERDINDLLWFIRNYSEKVQYYNKNNEPDGDWKGFIENDVSTIISVIAQKDISGIKECFANHFDFIKDASGINNNVKTSLNNIFKHLFFICDEINTWYNTSVPELKLHTELDRTITSQLKGLLKELIAAYKFAASNNFLNDNTPAQCSDFIYKGDFLSGRLKKIWIDDNTAGISTWNDYLSSINGSDILFGSSSSKIKRIKYAAEKLKLYSDKFINAQTRIIYNSPGYLKETLESWSSHEPHMALMLAFLQLFRYAQNSINKITKRHLDFYYKQVLKLKHNEAVPDEVHVIFELAKQVDSYLVKKGISLKAGKDSKGNEVVYTVSNDTVINKASVSELKTIYVDKEDNYRIYSAPVANSKDGNGTEFESSEPKWKTLGETQKTDSSYRSKEERTMILSAVGLAVTSPMLFLSQGERDIYIKFFTENNLADSDEDKIKNGIEFLLSSEKEWMKPEIKSVTVSTSDNTIEFKLKLKKEAEPVFAFNQSEIEESFDSEFPVLKMLLVNETGSEYLYEDLKDITITKIKITTEVKELRNLILQNDNGLLKAGKPFYPFTNFPGKDSNFYIGSKEIFQKNLDWISLHIEWKDIPQDELKDYYSALMSINGNEDFKVKGDALFDNAWKEIKKDVPLFKSNKAAEAINLTFSFPDVTQPDSYYGEVMDEVPEEYSTETRRGFFKITLTDPDEAFGHGIYREKYTKELVEYAKTFVNADPSKIPNEPYTPFVKEFWVDYKGSEYIYVKAGDTYKKSESKFIHIYPFGLKEERKSEPGKINLLPVFKFNNGTKDFESEGELFIGIKDLNPAENLSLLFQLAEGSADPELPKQEINWSYLKDNEWINFKDTEILSDETNGLIKSGIIKFSIPSEASNNNTVMPDNLYWLRASADKNCNAVCETIGVIAQAVSAGFQNNKNADDFLQNVLPAKTISKLVNKESSVKKVSQPYASAGGTPDEDDENFYTRVSERLRHKNRGISIWDYERLVLQNFTGIYKVKCINHSTYIPGASEFAPGYVSVVVIPDLYNKNAVNPLEPRVSVGTLNDIKNFLKKKISPFAAEKIQVINPLYEKVKVEFQVKLKKGYDWGYYKTKLLEDIKEFLSPWAYKKGSDISFGGKIHRSVILNFVEEREYVDYVAEFKMKQIITKAGITESNYVEEAEPTTARSIFVSYDNHDINEVINC